MAVPANDNINASSCAFFGKRRKTNDKINNVTIGFIELINDTVVAGAYDSAVKKSMLNRKTMKKPSDKIAGIYRTFTCLNSVYDKKGKKQSVDMV